jgi:hypothetical protein
MSTEALNKILDEVRALSVEERRQLLERLEREAEQLQPHASRRAGTLRGTVKYMAPDFDAPLDDFREYME